MPSRKPARKQPAAKRRVPWLGLAAVLVVGIGVLAYFRSIEPPPTPDAPVEAQAAPTYGARHIYSETADPRADIAAALARAKREHKRVILDFGGDWCGDCQVLDIYFHQPPNAELLEKNFVLVHVWIGQMDKNIDLAAKYGVPIKRGVPALAVLAADGKVLYAQSTGQFNNMSHMEPASVTEFLEKWKS